MSHILTVCISLHTWNVAVLLLGRQGDTREGVPLLGLGAGNWELGDGTGRWEMGLGLGLGMGAGTG